MYFHPWLHPRRLKTREELLDLIVADEYGKLWRDIAYTNAEIVELRRQRDEKEKQERAALHAALVEEARHRVAMKKFRALFTEGTQIIEGYRRAIVIYPGGSRASVYIELDDGSFKLNDVIPAVDALPDGSIRLPEPLTPLKGAGPSLRPQKKPQPPVLDLTEKEWHALPLPDTALTPASDDSPQPAPASLRKSDTTGRRSRGRQQGSGYFVGHESELIEHVIKLVKAWRINAEEKDPSLKEDPSPNDICTPSIWGSIPSSFPIKPSTSSLYKCLKVYGRTIGQPQMIWKTFLDSIDRQSRN